MSRTSRSKRSRRPPIAVVSIDDGSRRSSRQRSAGTSRRKRGELMDVAMGGFKSLTKGALMFLSAVVVYVVHEQQWNELQLPGRRATKVHVPSDLPAGDRRGLTLNLGGGNCLWQHPIHDVPDNIDFYKTAVVGYPSGDKRMVFQQMEALTGWAAKDEWDFEYLGQSNHPFVKANYPHHEGIWGWGTNADQVVMVIRNIRKSLTEYHDILYDIGYAKTWEEATLKMDQLYGTRPPIEAWWEWRDMRVLDECGWYGWFIDYWMEGGLMRDYFTHKITTPKHWNMLMMPTVYTYGELDYDVVVGKDTVVTPSYDPHCENGEISGGCEPVLVVSAEDLRDHDKGPAETEKIANLMRANPKMAPYVIEPEAWDCVWREMIVNGKGLKTIDERDGGESEYSFSAEMLEKMIWNLNRTITKYDSDEWNHLATSNRIVELLTGHRVLVQAELDEVLAGTRKLTDKSFLGPKERERRRLAAIAAGKEVESQDERKKHFEYFHAMEREHRKLKERRVAEARKKRQAERKEERKAERKQLRNQPAPISGGGRNALTKKE